jgi:hypothetical protein
MSRRARSRLASAPPTVYHQASGPAAPKRAADVAPHVRVLACAESDALHAARPHALRLTRVGRSVSSGGHPDETGENQDSGCDLSTHDDACPKKVFGKARPKMTPGPPAKVGPGNEPTLVAGGDVVKEAELRGGAGTTC